MRNIERQLKKEKELKDALELILKTLQELSDKVDALSTKTKKKDK